MAMVGFDPSVVNSSIGSVIRAYEQLYNAIDITVQNNFFQGMSDKWACRQAQTFFGKAEEVFKSIINSSNVVFTSVVDSMNSAARAWAAQTDSEYNSVQFSANSSTVDSSCILENIAGVRGVDVASAESTASSALNNVLNSANSALDAAVSSVTNSGFVGGNMQSNLVASLNTIKTNINSAVTDITSALKTAVSDTVATYGDTEGRVSQAFAGSH